MGRPHLHLKLNARPPERFVQEVQLLEKELDELAPGWRSPVRKKDGGQGIQGAQGIDDPERMGRVVYLLNRRKHLYADRDYGVRLVKTGRGVPVGLTVLPGRQVLHEGRAHDVARRLGVPVSEVSEVLEQMPSGFDAYTWAAFKLGLTPGAAS